MKRSARGSLFGAIPALVFVCAGLVWPLARLFASAFTSGTERAGMVRLFADAYYRRALADSLWFSAGVAAVSVALSFPAALALAQTRFRGRSIVRGVLALPLALSGVVVGFIAIATLGNAGLLPALLGVDRLRGAAYGLGGLFVAYLYFELPRATLALEAALAAIDPRQLEAARTLGARPLALLRYVWWPLSRPALRAAFAVTFAAAVGSFGVALVLGARFPLVPVEIYRAFTGTLDDSLAAALALVLAASALAILLLVSPRRRS